MGGQFWAGILNRYTGARFGGGDGPSKEEREREWAFREKEFAARREDVAFNRQMAQDAAERANFNVAYDDYNAARTREEGMQLRREDIARKDFGDQLDAYDKARTREEATASEDKRFALRQRERDEDFARADAKDLQSTVDKWVDLGEADKRRLEEREYQAKREDLKATEASLRELRRELAGIDAGTSAKVFDVYDGTLKMAQTVNASAAQNGAPIPYPDPIGTAEASARALADFAKKQGLGNKTLAEVAATRDLLEAQGSGDPVRLHAATQALRVASESRPAVPEPTQKTVKPPTEAETARATLADPQAEKRRMAMRDEIDAPIEVVKKDNPHFEANRQAVLTGFKNDPVGYSKDYKKFLAKYGLTDSEESVQKFVDALASFSAESEARRLARVRGADPRTIPPNRGVQLRF